MTYVPANKTQLTATNNDIPTGEVVKSLYSSAKEPTTTSISINETTMRNMMNRIFGFIVVIAFDSRCNTTNADFEYKSSSVYAEKRLMRINKHGEQAFYEKITYN